MPRIDTWLAEIGLEKYVSVFEDAEIDFETLPELVEDDLKELKLPLGPRRKIWGAISRMADVQVKQSAPDSSTSRSSPKSAAAAQDAQPERRHLTVMFVDLVGSTALSSRLDAEDMRQLMAEFQSEIAAVVGEFEGFVAQFLGDDILCYFGWPHANEDDTERAVRAGLLIIETARKLRAPDGTPLAVRVGIATGVVIVGDLMMNGTAQEAAAVGETTNLAARLQGVAGPNGLVISSNAASLLGASFDLTSLGKQELKGIGHPIEAFLVNGETEAESRFAARRPVALTPIVGRDREIGKVLQHWTVAQKCRGQMVLVRGEAGIGKSRLIQTIIDATATDDHSRVTYQCSPYHSDSAFYPFIRQLNYSAGFTPDDTNIQRITKMEKAVAGDRQSQARMALLLGIDGGKRYGKIEATPAQQRAQLMQTLLDHLINKSVEKPLLLVLEDLHWIDPTSLELLELLIAALPEHRIMVLATSRPSFDHDLAADPSVVEMALSRLDHAMTYNIASKMAGGKTLPNEIMEIIARRTDGVPLYVEELTKLILESGVVKQDGGSYQMNGTLSDIAIPATLHDSLMARLDRLGPIKEIAQIAACVGREFDHQLMLKICELPHYKLETALDQLIASEMIRRHGTLPDASYSFKHALVRDAAYDGLLKDRRKIYHERILSALEEDLDTAPELLATHAEAAQLTERAIELWEAAGTAATARPAYKEAEAHLRRAITLNSAKVASSDRAALLKAVSLKMKLFVALSPGIGLWADETVTTLEKALAFADQVGESPLRGDIIYGLVLATYFRGSLDSSLARAKDLSSHAEVSKDVAQLLVAKRITGIVQMNMGRFQSAQVDLDEATALCARVANQDLAARFGHDPVVGVAIYQAISAAFQGKTTLSNNYKHEAETRAAHIAHTNTSAAMLGLALNSAHISDDLAAERRHLKGLQAVIQEHAVTASHLWAEVAAALVRLAEGDPESVEAYQAAEAIMLNANIRLLVPGNRVLAARRTMDLGRLDAARIIASGVEPMMQKTGEKSWLPEYHRLLAAFALHDNEHEEAETALKTAITIARQSGGTLWEIRAANDLAALLQQQNRGQEAATYLTPAMQQIADGDCLREMSVAAEFMINLRR